MDRSGIGSAVPAVSQATATTSGDRPEKPCALPPQGHDHQVPGDPRRDHRDQQNDDAGWFGNAVDRRRVRRRPGNEDVAGCGIVWRSEYIIVQIGWIDPTQCVVGNRGGNGVPVADRKPSQRSGLDAVTEAVAPTGRRGPIVVDLRTTDCDVHAVGAGSVGTAGQDGASVWTWDPAGTSSTSFQIGHPVAAPPWTRRPAQLM
jgi:hypothetical protein